ncbi:unnamed protein product [Rhizophagus irregularis]|nr:unnamed protein product [Rhizophagus irregularis]
MPKNAGLVRGIRNLGSATLDIIQVAKGEADIFWEIAVRGGSPYAGDKTVEQSQLRLVREFWNIVEEIDYPRE